MFGITVSGGVFLAKVSKQQQNPNQSFLAGVKELVNQILLISSVPCHTMRYEQFRKGVFSMQR
jgi:hypothetical protein